MRKHALLMLGRANKSSPIPEPPESRIIEQFNTNKTGGPSEELGTLRLDFNGPIRSPWNLRAAQCFREAFTRSQLYQQWSREDVEEAFLRHIETIRTNYYKQVGRIPARTALENQIRSARRSRLKTVSVPLSHTITPCLPYLTADPQQTVHL